jgi:hypothetical protein
MNEVFPKFAITSVSVIASNRSASGAKREKDVALGDYFYILQIPLQRRGIQSLQNPDVIKHVIVSNRSASGAKRVMTDAAYIGRTTPNYEISPFGRNDGMHAELRGKTETAKPFLFFPFPLSLPTTPLSFRPKGGIFINCRLQPTNLSVIVNAVKQTRIVGKQRLVILSETMG